MSYIFLCNISAATSSCKAKVSAQTCKNTVMKPVTCVFIRIHPGCSWSLVAVWGTSAPRVSASFPAVYPLCSSHSRFHLHSLYPPPLQRHNIHRKTSGVVNGELRCHEFKSQLNMMWFSFSSTERYQICSCTEPAELSESSYLRLLPDPHLNQPWSQLHGTAAPP